MKTNILGAVAGLLAGVAVLGILAVLWQTLATTTAIRETQGDSRETLSLIRSCTTPAGACAQNGAQQTGEAIGQIGANSAALHRQTRTYAAVAAACADQPGTQTTRQIAVCIRKVIHDE